MTNFVLKSYNEDLAKDTERDHYGFRRSKRQSATSKRNWKEVSSDDSEAEHSDYGSESASEDEDQSSEGDDSDGDEYEQKGASPRKRARKKSGGNASKRVKTDEEKLRVIARVTSLAVNDDEGKNAEADMAKSKLDKVDLGVLDKIKKALALAAHAGTSEQEAKQAMRMANKVMQAHNISRADIIAAETQEQKVKRAGASVVTIRSTTGAKMLMASWTSALVAAMRTFFDVKAYSTKFSDRSRITWTFYGLAEGTVAAARAMEWCHNLILTWSAENKAAKGRNAKNLYCNGVSRGLYELARTERKAEARAVASAERERLERAAQEEAAQRAAEIARLDPQQPQEEAAGPPQEEAAGPPPAQADMAPQDTKAETKPPPPDRKAKVEDFEEDPFDGYRDRGPRDAGFDDEDDDESDWAYGGAGGGDDADFDDDDDVDEDMDLDAALRSAESKMNVRVKPATSPAPPPPPRPPSPPPVVKPEPQDDSAAWASTQQLTRFRSDANAIADAFLQEQFALQARPGQKSKKLKKARKAAPLQFKGEAGRAAYEKGKEDAKNIEVRRKRIEGAK